MRANLDQEEADDSMFSKKALIDSAGSFHGSRFGPVSVGFWDDLKNRRIFFEWVGKKLGIRNMEDWYKIKVRDVNSRGGGGLLVTCFDNSLSSALLNTFPEHEWKLWKFEQVSKGYWKNPQHCVECLDQIGKELGIVKMEDWYRIKRGDINSKGGWKLLQKNGCSISVMLEKIYPHHPWQHFMLSNTPKKYFENPMNVLQFMNWLEDKLLIRRKEDWYRVSKKQMEIMSPINPLMVQFGNLPQLLRSIYPNHPWDPDILSKPPSKASQRLLKARLETLFPTEALYEDYLHPDLRFESETNVQLDIFLPNLSLAFEYQGIQHFEDRQIFAPQRQYAHTDAQKRKLCKEAEITLIEIPHWWDYSEDTLRATIASIRPDLIAGPGNGTSISAKSSAKIPTGIPGRLSHPELWNNHTNPKGCWMSEKMDGVRAYWDGNKLYSKHGKDLLAPTSFIKDLPSQTPLDGELWMGRGSFEDLVASINIKDGEWNRVRYYVFDLPSSKDKYEERVDILKELILPDHVEIVQGIECQSPKHLEETLNSIVAEGGEGIILREPSIMW